MQVRGGWQEGDEGQIVVTFKDRRSGLPIVWDSTEAEVRAKPPGGSEAALESATEVGGIVRAPIMFDAPGTWTGHIILTGEYRRKIPWSVVVGND